MYTYMHVCKGGVTGFLTNWGGEAGRDNDNAPKKKKKVRNQHPRGFFELFVQCITKTQQQREGQSPKNMDCSAQRPFQMVWGPCLH